MPTRRIGCPPQTDEQSALMVSTFADFDPLTDVGVPTLAVVDEGIDAAPFLDGSARASLVVVLGPRDLRVGVSGRLLMDHDAAYRLEDLERIL